MGNEKRELKAGDVVKVYGETKTEEDLWGEAMLIEKTDLESVDDLPDWLVKFVSIEKDFEGHYDFLFVGGRAHVWVDPAHLVVEEME